MVFAVVRTTFPSSEDLPIGRFNSEKMSEKGGLNRGSPRGSKNLSSASASRARNAGRGTDVTDLALVGRPKSPRSDNGPAARHSSPRNGTSPRRGSPRGKNSTPRGSPRHASRSRYDSMGRKIPGKVLSPEEQRVADEKAAKDNALRTRRAQYKAVADLKRQEEEEAKRLAQQKAMAIAKAEADVAEAKAKVYFRPPES